MLIKLEELIKAHNLKIKGVIHVGAHYGEEYEDYIKSGIQDVIFIEPQRHCFEILQEKFKGNDKVVIINTACGSSPGKAEMFTETANKGQSSSLLQPALHLKHYPDIEFTGTEKVSVLRLDDVIYEISRNRTIPFNFINIDVQGFEGEVFKGATEVLKGIDYIYSEVNTANVYEGCILLPELDNLLEDFKRVETKLTNAHWGDALYIRKSLL